jgi:hypothetical protein
MSKFIVSKTLLNKFAHCWGSNLLTENQFCSRRIMKCPSFYLQSKYGLMTQFLSIQKLLKAKKICSQQRKMLRARICWKNLLTEFARTIEKLLTMKNLAGLDGSIQWLNVLHQANRSIAGAHHSTVSVVTTGTCWARPSREALHTDTPSECCSIYWYCLTVTVVQWQFPVQCYPH